MAGLNDDQINKYLLEEFDCEMPDFASDSEVDGDEDADEEFLNMSLSNPPCSQNVLCGQQNWNVLQHIIESSDDQDEESSTSESDDDDDDKWSKNRQWFTTQIVPVPPFSEKATPTHMFSRTDGPLVYFERFFSPSIEDLLIKETNRYASQKSASNWKDITKEELRAFVAILILMGIHVMPTVNAYWSSDPLLCVPAIANIMPRNRFKQLLSTIHCNDNEKQPKFGEVKYDKLYKIRPLLDKINDNCMKECKPSSCESIDETMIAFKGRSSIKQYMPLKPVKRGYKSWSRCDSHTGYLYQFIIYTGKTENKTEQGLGEKVVLDLTSSIQHTLSFVVFDNYYTSTELLEKLLLLGIWSCGTVRVHRKGLPKILKEKPNMERGAYRWRTKQNVCAIQWKDNRHVNLLTTAHDPLEVVTVERTRTDGSKQVVSCPSAIKEYNRHMGGVDKFDQMRQYYMIGRRSKKWWLRIFYFLLDVAIVNSYVLFNIMRDSFGIEACSQLQYRIRLVHGLLGCYSSRNAKGPRPKYISKKNYNNIPPEIRCNNVGVHLPSMAQKYRRCKLCSSKSKEKRTKVMCSKCDVPLCAVPCFKAFHT